MSRILFVLFLVFICKNEVMARVDIHFKSSKKNFSAFQYKAQPGWKKIKGKKHFVIKTKLSWPNRYRISKITQLSKNVNVNQNITPKKNTAWLTLREVKSRFKVETKNNDVFYLEFQIKPSKKSFYVSSQCTRFSIKIKSTKKKNLTPYLSGIDCYLQKAKKEKKNKNIKNKKKIKKVSKENSKKEKESVKKVPLKSKKEQVLVVVFSTLIGVEIDCSLFEVEGKGETTRFYEFLYVNGAISTYGKLGTFYWGKEKYYSEIELHNAHKYFLKKKSEELNSYHDNRHLGVGFNTLSFSKDDSKTDNQEIFLTGEISDQFGSTKFGYFAAINILTSSSDKDKKIDYYDFTAAGTYWFYLGNSTLGPVLGVRLLKNTVTVSDFSTDIQAPLAGLSFEWPWWNKHKLFLYLGYSSLDGLEGSGSEMNARIMQDFTVFSIRFFAGINYSSYAIESKIDETKVKNTVTGFTLGINL